jgi:hypothetical protein
MEKATLKEKPDAKMIKQLSNPVESFKREVEKQKQKTAAATQGENTRYHADIRVMRVQSQHTTPDPAAARSRAL